MSKKEKSQEMIFSKISEPKKSGVSRKMTTESILNTKIIRKPLAIGIPCVTGWIFAIMAIYYFRDYSYGLFIWLPAVLGALSTMIYGFQNIVYRKVFRNIS
jgi:hypothetical protein